MVTCPNCSRIERDSFKYCSACGSNLESGISGDYTTNVSNVFRQNGGYIYIFSENGRQKVIRDKTVDGLREKVLRKSFPWIEDGVQTNMGKNHNSTRNISNARSLFLRISAEAEVKVIPTSSTSNPKSLRKAKKTEVKVKRDVGNVSFRNNIQVSSNRINNLSRKPLPDPKWKFGVVGVKKVKEQLKTMWVFEGDELFKAEYLDDLKDMVISAGHEWKIIDGYLENSLVSKDRSFKAKRESQFLKQKSDKTEHKSVHLPPRNDCSLEKMFL